MASKEFSIIMRALGGAQVQAELTKTGRAATAAFDEVQRASGRANGSLINTGNQLQDVFVQWAAGTDPMRAVGMQLPQLLSGFGLLGVILGTATAALSVFAGNLFATEDDLKAVEERVDALAEAIKNLREAEGALDNPFSDLVAQYGDASVEALRLLQIRRELAGVRADREFGMASRSLGTSLVGSDIIGGQSSAELAALEAQISGLDERYAALNAEIEAFGDISTAADQAAWDALQARRAVADEAYRTTVQYREELIEIADQYGMTQQQAARFAVLAADVREATDATSRLAAARQLMEYIYESTDGLRTATDEGATLYDRLVDVVQAGMEFEAIDIVGPIARGADEAIRLIGNIRLASSEMLAFGRGQQGADPLARTGMFSGQNGAIYAVSGKGVSGAKGRAGGGGGGVSEDERDAQRLYEQTRTDAEKFAAEQAKINMLFAKGKIDLETYTRALDMIEEKYEGAGDATKFFSDMTGDLKDSIIDLAMNGGASLDSLIEKLQAALYQALLFDQGPLAALLGGNGDGKGGLLGGALDWLLGDLAGARAGGGSVAGGRTYLVGEKGPELFTPISSGMITANDRIAIGGGGRGTVVQVIDQRSGGAPVQTETRRGPTGEELIVMTVRDATAAGRMDGANRGRYGLQAQKVRR